MIPSVLFFGGRTSAPETANPHDPKIPRQLNRLFKLVPKTEDHLHLSGSARKIDVEDFMRENGLSDNEVKQEMGLIKPFYKSLTDFLVSYYRVPKHVSTPSQFKRAAMGIVKDCAEENVRVLEIRSSVLNKGGTPEEIIEAIEEGMRDGMAWVKKHKGYEMKTGLIILAQRFGTPEQSMEHAQLAVKMAQRPGSLIRGFDLAGDETKHSIDKHAPAIEYFNKYGKPLGLGLTLHAGEVPVSENISGLDSIQKAIKYGADRIGHGLQLDMDPALKQQLIQKQVPIELCPWSNVQIGAVSSYKDHPVARFLEEGLNVSLSTDNRLVSQIDLTKQLGQLWANGLITSMDQIKRLTINGIRMSFIPETDKKRVEKDVLKTFKQLERRYARTIRRYLPNKPATQTKMA